MKIKEIVSMSNEFHLIMLESNEELIDYTKILAEDMSYYYHGKVNWRGIFRHAVNESHNSIITNFINRFKSLDQRRDIKINIGTKIAIINLVISIVHSGDQMYLYGDTNLKTITKINRDATNNRITQIEFNNDPYDVYPRKYRAIHSGNDIDHSIFFKDKESAKQAVSILVLSAPSGMLDTKGVKGL